MCDAMFIIQTRARLCKKEKKNVEIDNIKGSRNLVPVSSRKYRSNKGKEERRVAEAEEKGEKEEG